VSVDQRDMLSVAMSNDERSVSFILVVLHSFTGHPLLFWSTPLLASVKIWKLAADSFETRIHQFQFQWRRRLSFVEPGRRWAYSPSPSKASGISYQGTMKTSVRIL